MIQLPIDNYVGSSGTADESNQGKPLRGSHYSVLLSSSTVFRIS